LFYKAAFLGETETSLWFIIGAIVVVLAITSVIRKKPQENGPGRKISA
jgi:glycerol uptake facilitator protein